MPKASRSSIASFCDFADQALLVYRTRERLGLKGLSDLMKISNSEYHSFYRVVRIGDVGRTRMMTTSVSSFSERMVRSTPKS